MASICGDMMSNGFRVYIRKAIEGGKSIFPEKFCVGADPEGKRRDLDNLRLTQGSYHFSSQYLNDPVDDDSIEFKRKFIRYYETLPPEGSDQLFLDPAFTTSRYNDFCGIIVTRITKDNMVYVMEAIKERFNETDLIAELFRLNKIYSLTMNFVEGGAAQVGLIHNIRQAQLSKNVFFPIEEYRPVTKENKQARIRHLIPRFEAGQILLRPGLKTLENDLIEFPRNAHDDLLDAFAQGHTYWVPPSDRRTHEIKEGTLDWWAKKIVRTQMTRIGQGFYDIRPM